MNLYDNSLPKVSIITVCYNSEKDLENTILSTIRQDYPNYEYIIIDGGSTDGTIDIIKKYESYITIWISERDKGIYDAMNKGIKMASGDWIHFRNSGDLFYSKSSISDIFKNVIPSNTVVVHGNCRFTDNYGYKDVEPPILNSETGLMPVLHPSTFVLAEYHKKHLFDLQYKSSADFNFFFQCQHEGVKIMYFNVLVSVMDVSDGMSRRNFMLVWTEDFKIKHQYHNVCRLKMYDMSFFKTALYRWLIEHVFTPNFYRKRVVEMKKQQGWVLTEEKYVPTFISY